MFNNFDIVAPLYQIGESLCFGKLLQTSRIAFSDNIESSNNVLLLGEGRGFFLNYLLNLNKKCVVSVVESSSVMIRYQKSMIAHHDIDRVSFYNVPLQKFKSCKKFDLVCSFYFWDCFRSSEINFLLPKAVTYLSNGGYWINSDFVDGQFRRNKINFLKIRIMYLFFQLLTGIRASSVLKFGSYAAKNSLSLKISREIEPNFIRSELFQKII